MEKFINNGRDKYIMYLRKSRKDDEMGKDEEIEDVLKRHEEILYRLADSLDINKNQIIIKREVVSGETISARPVIQEVLRMIEDDNIKGVLVVEVERLARGDTIDQRNNCKSLQIYKYKNYDTTKDL